MFNTTLDILYFVLACSAGVMTIVLVVFFIYLISAMAKANKILKELAGIGKIILFLKKKVEHSAGHLGLISEAISRIVWHFIEGKIEVKKKK